MNEEDALLGAILATPEDMTPRLIYADWLEERGHPGAGYLRAEIALADAAPGDAPDLRRSMLACIPSLPKPWRDRFEQPDLLLAPPAPFWPGWYSANASAPTSYFSLPNLDPEGFSPDLPWLSGVGTRERVDQEEHELEELAALAEIQEQAMQLGLILPSGFEPFARDFCRRGAISAADSYYQVCLHDAVVEDFPQVGEGYLVLFFADMNYGNPHQLAWSLYLVPGVAWHCVVGFKLGDDVRQRLPDDPADITYCAPSFQAFLYRWWRQYRSSGINRNNGLGMPIQGRNAGQYPQETRTQPENGEPRQVGGEERAGSSSA